MDLSWSTEQTELHDRIVQFAQRELGAPVAELDRKEEFNHAAWRKCAEFGIQGLPITPEYGGRFHPERAAIWEPNSPVATPEAWLGAQVSRATRLTQFGRAPHG